MRAPPVRIPAAAQHDLDLLTEHAAEFFEYMHIEPPPGGKYSQGVIVGAALAASRLFVLKMQAQPDPGNAGEIVGSEVEVERLKNDLDAANTALANERAARSAYAARQRELGRSQINIWMSAEEAAWVREALDKRRAGGAQIDLEDTIAAGPHAVVGFWLSTVEADVASVDAADAFAATEARFAQLRRADGTLPADWAFVATFGPAGTPALAALGHQVIGQDFEIDDQGGSGDRVWVVGLAVSTGAALITRLRRPQPLQGVEDVLDQSAGDLQFVAALDAENRAVHTCESFDVGAIRRAAGG